MHCNDTNCCPPFLSLTYVGREKNLQLPLSNNWQSLSYFCKYLKKRLHFPDHFIINTIKLSKIQSSGKWRCFYPCLAFQVPMLSWVQIWVKKGLKNIILSSFILDGRTLINKYKERDVCDMIFLHNKEASWDRKLNSYVLNFQGRANQVKKNYLF